MARRAWVRRIAVALGAVAALAAAAGGVQLHRASRLKRIAASAEAASRPLVDDCRWVRPVTGGPALPCNGDEEEHAAARHLFADAEVGAIAKADLLGALEHDRPPPPDVAAFLASHGPALAALRDSTRCSWACVQKVIRDDYRRGSTFDAADLLLHAARAAAPAECLSTAFAAQRILLDDASGVAGWTAYSSPHERRRMHETRRTLLACAAKAPLDAALLDAAARDAASVAAHPPPVGDALAVAALFRAVSLAEDAEGKRVDDDLLWIQRGVLLDAADDTLASLPALRAYRDDEMPALFDRLARDLPPARRAPLGDRKPYEWSISANARLDTKGMLAPTLSRHAHLYRDLRLTAAALAALRDRAAKGAWPAGGPAELAYPALRDPFTGEPFEWVPGPAIGQVNLMARRGKPDPETGGLAQAEAVSLP
jgi:hypothetical protein